MPMLEEDLLQMARQFRPPTEAQPPMAPEQVPMDMPMGDFPMEDMPMDMGAEVLPEFAMVMDIDGGLAILQDNNGRVLRVPLEAFPIPPEPGMNLVQAVVVDIADGVMVVDVGGMTMDLPMDSLMADFEIGEYFWLPEPPSSPEDMNVPIEF